MSTIKTWQERIVGDERTYAVDAAKNSEIADLRAALATKDAPALEAVPDDGIDQQATAELHAILAQYPPESWTVRNRAFEEAAAICDRQAERARTSPGSARADACATAIRAMKSDGPPAKQEAAPLEAVPEGLTKAKAAAIKKAIYGLTNHSLSDPDCAAAIKALEKHFEGAA